MKTSPDPLQPLRTWRELWVSEPTPMDFARRFQNAYPARHWKKQRQFSLQWFDQLLSRDLEN